MTVHAYVFGRCLIVRGEERQITCIEHQGSVDISVHTTCERFFFSGLLASLLLQHLVRLLRKLKLLRLLVGLLHLWMFAVLVVQHLLSLLWHSILTPLHGTILCCCSRLAWPSRNWTLLEMRSSRYPGWNNCLRSRQKDGRGRCWWLGWRSTKCVV